MPLTPLDIHNKEFKRSFRGYDEEEVDVFLDQVVDSYEALYKENISLKEALENKDTNISQYRDLEETLKKTLVVAQQTAEEVKLNSQKQAEVLLKEAELKAAKLVSDAGETARGILRDAEQRTDKLNRETEEFRKNLQVFKLKFRSFLDSQLALIDQSDEVFNDSVLFKAVPEVTKGTSFTLSEMEAAATDQADNNVEDREARIIPEKNMQIINKEVIL